MGGLAIPDDVASAIKELDKKKEHRFVIMKLDENKTSIELEHIGERDKTWDDMKALIGPTECRFVFYDLEWENFRKILLFAFAPDNAHDKDAKFVVAANKGKLNSKWKPNGAY